MNEDGAGVGLALSADFVLASTNMKLRIGYSALGLSPDMGTSWFLARRAGATRARQLLMNSESVDAAQCLAWDLVDALHAPDILPLAALDLAPNLAKSSHTSIAASKALSTGCLTRTLEQQLNLEHRHLGACAGTPDAKQGVAAFADRRQPVFPSTLEHPEN